MLVYIRSVPRETATKVHELVNPASGQRMNKTKMGPCSDGMMCLYSAKIGALATGLDGPWIEDGIQKLDPITNKPLTMQDKMEDKHNLPKGYLTNRAWRNGDSGKEEDMTYFQKKVWRFQDGSTVLDTSNMEDELTYYAVLAHKLVANSEKELRDHLWSEAKYFIAQENEEAEMKASKNKIKSQLKAVLVDPEFPYSYQMKFVHLLKLAPCSTSITAEMVFNLLHDYIDSSNHIPGSNIDKFRELAELLKTPAGRAELEARHLLQRALDGRVIFEKQGAYNWPRPTGTITLGEKYTEAVDYILDPKKNAMLDDLEAELKLKGV